MKITKFVKNVMNDSLYRNSIYLMLGTLVMSFLGFIFWMVASRLYSVEDIGLATAIISVMGLIVGLSVLGLNVGLIRYLPKSKDKNRKINTCFTLVALATIVVSVFFIMFSKFVSPKLMFIHNNMFLAFAFIFFMIFASMGSIMDSVFVAFRNTKYILIKNSVFSSLKILGLFVFVSLGAFGIFASWMISLIIGLGIVLVVLIKKYDYVPRFAFHDSIIKKMGAYSFGNYIAGFIGGLPILILPILILNKLGAEMTAYYYMAMMIAGTLFVIPGATANSLFAEGSYDERDLGKQIRKAIKIIGALLIPAILIIIFFGQYILMLFGKEYASEGIMLLKLLAVSGVFVGANGLMGTLLKVKKRIWAMVFVSIVNAVVMLGIAYNMLHLGLIGIGYSWIVGQGIVGLVYLVVLLWKE